MKWDEMSPRERDALVAEKVMGRDDKVGVCVPRRGTTDDTFGRVLPDGYHERTPLYTTDISAAWEVVENMRRDGWEPDIESSKFFGWQAWFAHECFDAGYANNENVCEAICLAALRAVGVDVE